jgi:hypothetical protein
MEKSGENRWFLIVFSACDASFSFQLGREEGWEVVSGTNAFGRKNFTIRLWMVAKWHFFMNENFLYFFAHFSSGMNYFSSMTTQSSQDLSPFLLCKLEWRENQILERYFRPIVENTHYFEGISWCVVVRLHPHLGIRGLGLIGRWW